MNTKKLFKLHNAITKEFGDDVVVSLILDNGKHMLAVATHKSQLEYKTTSNDMQICNITEYDLTKSIDSTIEEVVGIFKNILYKPEKTETESDNVTE